MQQSLKLEFLITSLNSETTGGSCLPLGCLFVAARRRLWGWEDKMLALGSSGNKEYPFFDTSAHRMLATARTISAWYVLSRKPHGKWTCFWWQGPASCSASTLLGIWLWKGTICNDENQHRQSPSWASQKILATPIASCPLDSRWRWYCWTE